MDDAFQAQLCQINSNFKLAGLPLQLEVRGQKIYGRGILPPKGHRLKPHQQRLNLGEYADLEGLKSAECQAKLVAAHLVRGSFSWDYFTKSAPPVPTTITGAIARYEQHFIQTRGRSCQTTWKTAYAPYFAKLQALLPQGNYSDAEIIYQAILATAPDTRSRQICCTAMKGLADFMGLTLPFDLQKLSGNYGIKHLKPRQLPDDQTIKNSYYQIPNPKWRFVYGIMATFGLRNHEVFFCDYDNLQKQIDNHRTSIIVKPVTKTGSHEVWAFPPAWIDEFNLRSVVLPPINTDLDTTTLQKIGQQVNRQFRRYQLPFSPYNLRHAWAVRAIHIGLPDPIAAQMMGHSLTVHNQTYQRWLSRRDQQQAVDAAWRGGDS